MRQVCGTLSLTLHAVSIAWLRSVNIMGKDITDE
jgi:hypothetical protein